MSDPTPNAIRSDTGEAKHELTCAFCGHTSNMPPSTEAAERIRIMAEHIMTCEKHPLHAAVKEGLTYKNIAEAMDGVVSAARVYVTEQNVGNFGQLKAEVEKIQRLASDTEHHYETIRVEELADLRARAAPSPPPAAGSAEERLRELEAELDAEDRYVELCRGWLARERGAGHICDPDDPDGPTRAARAVAFTEARWQEAIDKVVSKVYPNRDGSGSDADALALTVAEIQQAFNHLAALAGK